MSSDEASLGPGLHAPWVLVPLVGMSSMNMWEFAEEQIVSGHYGGSLPFCREGLSLYQCHFKCFYEGVALHQGV